MHAVRLAYPGAKLTLVTSPGKRGTLGAVELLTGVSWLDELFVYHNEEIQGLRHRFALAKRLRQKTFDVWIELPNDLATIRVLLRNMFLAVLSGARWAYGWRLSTIRWAARAQSERKVFPNEVDRLLRVVEACGIPAQQPRFPLPLTQEHASAVEALFQDSVPPEAPLVAIAPGAKRSTNRWPLDRYAEVANVLSRQGFFVLLIGGAGDKDSCERIASHIQVCHFEQSEKSRSGFEPKRGPLNLAGQLSVLESCEALRRCAFVVCNDSGVQHMAAAVSTPCISIFSFWQLRGKWRPYGGQHVVLQKDVPCHTCYLDECPHDNLCVKLVQVSDVLHATALVAPHAELRPSAANVPENARRGSDCGSEPALFASDNTAR
jgi:ADP-heptose:LPS heptosyltransferase